ncbi:MAG: restriction endonuclease subunit S [Fimbriimonadaceae bacterium]
MAKRRYSQYSDSESEFLGLIPSHWNTTRLKNVSRHWVSSVDKHANDDEIPVRLCNYTDVYYHEFIDNGMPFMEATATREEIAKFRLSEGDVMITKDSEDWRDIAVPALVRSTASDLVCGYHLALVRSSDSRLLPLFVFRLFQSGAMNRQYQIASNGVTRFGLPKQAIGEAVVPLPSVDEQTAICTYIDARTDIIDQLVEKKKRLIELLKEKRAALITQIATRGFPPEEAKKHGLPVSRPMKASGIDWLGDLPEHWKVARLMYCTHVARPIMYGIVLPGPDVEDGVPIIKGGDVKPGRLSHKQVCRTTEEIESKYVRSRVKKGDIVFSIRGTVGEAELVPEDLEGANITQDAARVSPSVDVCPKWLLFCLKASAVIAPTLALSLGAAVRGVNIRDLKRISIPLPPKEEQLALVSYLDFKLCAIDELVKRTDTGIRKLLELRESLITLAVTGMIDVRQEVIA